MTKIYDVEKKNLNDLMLIPVIVITLKLQSST